MNCKDRSVRIEPKIMDRIFKTFLSRNGDSLFRKTALVGVFLLSGLSNNLTAEEIPGDKVSPRAAGMGDAYTAVANDEGAVFYNPAGIARARKARSRSTFHIAKFPNLIAGANSEARSFYEGYKSSQE